uniref:EGF-like domain-containing protein n=1 Tax=Heliothis virescens TaxID=7102 RepID=A0A2A4J0A1_HELVI
MLVNRVIYVLIIVSALVDVKGQVCFKAIRGYAARRRFIITRVCCEGYAKEPGTTEISVDTCKPICNTNCTNGYCKHPRECACNAGYTLRDDICAPAPLCEECSHGVCVAPDTCRCDPGYSLVHGKCQPVCTTHCVNGTCVSPDTCQCLPGYTRSNLRTSDCEPICSSGCIYGYCVAPEICICHSGWQYGDDKNDTCSPVCKVPCGNGTCIFPNACACFLGYRNSILRSQGADEAPVCKPICVDCKGVCVAPNKCEEETLTTIAVAMTSVNPLYNSLADTVPTAKSFSTFHWSSTENLVDIENSNFTLEKPTKHAWMQRHKIILISTVIIVIAGIIAFIAWQRLPMRIIYFFKGKSYNIQGAGLRRHVSSSSINVQFLSRLESRT